VGSNLSPLGRHTRLGFRRPYSGFGLSLFNYSVLTVQVIGP
jgi:hypothetical protein